MSNRLPIVLVHRQSHLDPPSVRRSTAALDRMTEDLVGHLAGRPGLDLVLVAPLSELKDGDPDTLTLESIAHDVVVITRTTPEESIDHLSRIGFSGIRTKHRDDPGAEITTDPGRRVYVFDLGQMRSVDAVIQSVERLRSIQAVKTFSLLPSESKLETSSPGQGKSDHDRTRRLAQPVRMKSMDKWFDRSGLAAQSPDRVAKNNSLLPRALPPRVELANSPASERPTHTRHSDSTGASLGLADDSLDDLIDELDQADI